MEVRENAPLDHLMRYVISKTFYRRKVPVLMAYSISLPNKRHFYRLSLKPCDVLFDKPRDRTEAGGHPL